MSTNIDSFELDKNMKLDLRWWYRLAPLLNFDSMMILEKVGVDEEAEMDASTSFGLGGVSHTAKEFFMCGTPEMLKEKPIHCHEMMALMLGHHFWAQPKTGHSYPGWHAKELVFRSDNTACIDSVHKERPDDDFLAAGLRYILMKLALCDARLTLTYIRSKDNIVADGLSRGSSDVRAKLMKSGYAELFVSNSLCLQLMESDI